MYTSNTKVSASHFVLTASITRMIPYVICLALCCQDGLRSQPQQQL